MKTIKVIILVVVCLLVIAPMVQAKKPGTGGGGKSSKYSTLTEDFIAGPTKDKWTTSTFWLVEWNKGGPITVWDTPDDIRTGTSEDGRNYIEWDTHGERIGGMRDSNGKDINIKKLKAGTYEYPSTEISWMPLWIHLDGWTQGDDHNVMLTIILSRDNFEVDDIIYIIVTSSTITFTGDHIPFDYVNFRSVGEGYHLAGPVEHDFTIVIDR